jgi:hypothetical protein
MSWYVHVAKDNEDRRQIMLTSMNYQIYKKIRVHYR